MRTLSRYEPANERRHNVIDTGIIKTNDTRKDNLSNGRGKYFGQTELQERNKQLNEFNGLRTYFVMASHSKHCNPHASLKSISAKGVKQKKENKVKGFLMDLFSL